MTTTADLDITVFSGLNHIDALLDHGPDWNFQNPGGNVIAYTFSIASGNEPGETGQKAFTAAQMANTRVAMAYVSSITGIVFSETATGTGASVHFSNTDIPDFSTSGLCSWYSDASVQGDKVLSYKGTAYIYLDNTQFGAQNGNLTPGSAGYETLLHEIGHMLGLKHPFETSAENSHTLPYAEDSSAFTLMSYRDVGGPYSTFAPYDIAALDWLYGRDGLGGALGIGSVTGARYITGSAGADMLVGTAFNDTLRGNGGNDVINGGDGEDTAIFSGSSTSYVFSDLGNNSFQLQGADGIDTLTSIEIFQFSNGTFRRSEIVDTTPPPVPSLSVPKNANGYVNDNTPFLSGIGEIGATIKVFSGAAQLGVATVDAKGFWTMTSIALADGSYSVVATATDASGNVSAGSAPFAFKVDAHAPSAPTAAFALAAGSNQPTFSGTGEVGTDIYLVDVSNAVLGKAVVDGAGKWSIATAPVANGNYNVTVQSADLADNTTAAASKLLFAINSTLNKVGTAGNDTISGTAGNNALSGLGGTDTALYAGARASYTVAEASNGFTVTAKSGTDGLDSLIGIERIKFSDASVALDIDGVGGQAYRLYKAAYDRAPDLAGVGFWMSKMDQGVSLSAVAADFVTQKETTDLYGTNSSNTTFVNLLYQHVLHRPLDQAGADFWVKGLDNGVARGEVLKGFSESGENIAQLVATTHNGFEYIPFLG